MKTPRNFAIVWHTGIYGDFQQGIEFFGMCPGATDTCDVDPAEYGWSPPGADAQMMRLEADGISIVCFAVRINQWTDDAAWLAMVKGMLAGLVDKGALVAWCGDVFSNCMPLVLDPSRDAGRVYAAYSRETGFFCNTGLSQEVRYLEPAQLAALWGIVAALKRERNPNGGGDPYVW